MTPDHPAPPPTILIRFDPETFDVSWEVNTEALKTHDVVLHCLNTMTDAVRFERDTTRRLAVGQQLAEQARQAEMAQAVQRSIDGGARRTNGRIV